VVDENNEMLLSVRMDLRTYLDSNGLDEAAFASRLEVTREAVLLWLAGARMPRPAMLKRIVEKTNGRVTANDFMNSRPESREVAQ
jgi:transcriptional regulator with XRE-family HTH domain